MADEVQLRLIFANDTHSADLTVPLSRLVRDVKKTIMEDHWPPSMPALETVERVRLFAGGRELGGKEDDSKSLRDAKLAVSPNSATPVHVQPVLRAAGAAVEKETPKPAQCFCVVL